MRPKALFTLLARVVALTWALLLVAVAAHFFRPHFEVALRFVLGLHLASSLAYTVGCWALWTNHRWLTAVFARAVLCVFVPFLTLWFARWARKNRELTGDWRLGRNGSYAYSVHERGLYHWMRQPIGGTILVGLAIVAIVVLTVRSLPGIPALS
ncbi:MAG: DUF3817 domain-containing protein [Tetrasphaera sp.]|nr:DUF3817 domain-containing protein [Tetrasphaera sp.]